MKPRVIRKVTKHYRTTGRPKMARDMRLNIDVARVRAMAPHTCAKCKKPITEAIYLKVYFRNRMRRIGSALIPETEDLHVGCLPSELKPLLRLLRLT